MMSVSWNPWHGCLRISEGCDHCYVYRQDAAWQKDSSRVSKTAAFGLPVRRRRDRRWKIADGEVVYTCFTSDFLLAEADVWRAEIWEMIRLRRGLHFMFFTKRIDRLATCLPEDWGEGYENVTIGCTVENQLQTDYRLPIFLRLPIRHKVIVCAPLLEPIDLRPYLSPQIKEVSVGGESGTEARICDYAWVLSLREQCVERGVAFCFHQTGARLLKEDRLYRIARENQHTQAVKAELNFKIDR